MRKDRLLYPEKHRARQRVYAAANKEKKYAATKKWRKDKPHKQRQLAWRQQGLPAPTRPETSTCECCGNLSKIAMTLDHDHNTGKFRGWLCRKCNTNIAGLGDNIDGVKKALAYLERNTWQEN